MVNDFYDLPDGAFLELRPDLPSPSSLVASLYDVTDNVDWSAVDERHYLEENARRELLYDVTNQSAPHERKTYVMGYNTSQRGTQLHPISDPHEIEAFLSQTKWWVPGNGQAMKIKDMEMDHLQNAAVWLLDHANQILILRFAVRYGNKAPESISAVYSSKPDAKLEITTLPLFRALVLRLADIVRHPASRWRLDEDEDDTSVDEVYG